MTCCHLWNSVAQILHQAGVYKYEGPGYGLRRYIKEDVMETWYQPQSYGKQSDSTLGSLLSRLKDFREDPQYKSLSGDGRDGEWVLGFAIPPFQRQHVWTRQQEIAFVDSARKGFHLGSYMFNTTLSLKEALRTDENGRQYYFADLWLLDGMQRLTALQRFFDDEFPVAGLYWSEVPQIDRRFILRDVHFTSYETHLTDEKVMREIYDAMNFGGTAHREEERAVAALSAGTSERGC